mmetsp:Transcript_42176/g.83410  ORF Transcript_42176/g.83410 Transcript_42176/m.83410 type:complete len:611 (+) Transcript_42176:96-1928(+)
MAQQSDVLQAGTHSRDLPRSSDLLSRSFSGIADVSQQQPSWFGWSLSAGTMGVAGGGLALAPTFVLAGAAAETGGAAAITSGLTSFGAGSTMCGVGNLGLLGGAFGTAVVWSLVREEQAKVRLSVTGASAVGAAVGCGVCIGLVTACAAAGTGGAAVITSGLAALGGGSIAAGGLGMAGGMIACTGIGFGVAILFGLVAFSIWWYLGETGKNDDDPTGDCFFNAACEAIRIQLSSSDFAEDGTAEPHEKLIMKPHALQPTFNDFGTSFWWYACASCNTSICNSGCSVCERHFCQACFPDHVRSCCETLNVRCHIDFVVAQAEMQNDDDPSPGGHVTDLEMPGLPERRSMLRSGTVAILVEIHKQLKDVDSEQPWFQFWKRRGPSFIKRILRLLALQLLFAAFMDPDEASADNIALASAFNDMCKYLTTKGSEQFGVPYARLLCEALDSFCTKLKQGTNSVSIQYARAFFELQSGASREDIISAHRRLSRRMHPDKASTEDQRQVAHCLQGYINVSREKLLNLATESLPQNPLELTDGMESQNAELQKDANAKLTPFQWIGRLRGKYVRLQGTICNDRKCLRKHFMLDNLRLEFEEGVRAGRAGRAGAGTE